VLDLEPSKYHLIRPIQDPSGNFILTIKEDKASPRPKDRHITINRPGLGTVAQTSNVQEPASGTGRLSALNVVKDRPSIEQGQSQLNDGEFAAAVDTLTQILATDQNNSLIYRLRGDAFDNLGDEQSALKDWTEAARLGDAVIQSSLDSQGVKWRENPPQ
jgi:tetratricopeptide (TPR) repeat protein